MTKKKKEFNDRKCPLLSCKSIELGLCFDILDISLSECPKEKAYFYEVENIAKNNDVDVEDVMSLCRAHGKFLKIDT